MEIRGALKNLDGGYQAAVRDGLHFIDFHDLVDRDCKVFIKPNLTFPSYRPGVMTSPQAIESAILAIRDYTSHIYIGDGDAGGYNRFSMDQVYRDTGLLNFAKKYEVRFVNLSRLPRRTISFQCRGRDFSLDLPRLLLDEIDLLISMPVPKMHANSGVSLALKNLWGCIPEPEDRLRLHPYLKQVVLEVCQAVHASVAIVDGRYGLNVNGPMRGRPVELNWILVANDLGASVRLTCELMQVPLEKIPHLRYAQQSGVIPALGDIVLNQDFRPFLKERFSLRREWTDYPGYLAYRIPFLAYLAYFSPLAKVLHRILYLFREPFYEYRQ
jgi:uncharacterized protein (DUF362 family)